MKQDGCTSDMMFKIPALIEHVSSIMTLEVRIASFSGFHLRRLPHGPRTSSGGRFMTCGREHPGESLRRVYGLDPRSSLTPTHARPCH